MGDHRAADLPITRSRCSGTQKGGTQDIPDKTSSTANIHTQTCERPYENSSGRLGPHSIRPRQTADSQSSSRPSRRHRAASAACSGAWMPTREEDVDAHAPRRQGWTISGRSRVRAGGGRCWRSPHLVQALQPTSAGALGRRTPRTGPRPAAPERDPLEPTATRTARTVSSRPPQMPPALPSPPTPTSPLCGGPPERLGLNVTDHWTRRPSRQALAISSPAEIAGCLASPAASGGEPPRHGPRARFSVRKCGDRRAPRSQPVGSRLAIQSRSDVSVQ